MIHVLVIPADYDKPVEVREIEAGLDVFQALVGGYIEAIALWKLSDHDLYINEEGKLLPLPFNMRATRLYHAGVGRTLDIILGDAFVTGPVDSDGEATSVRSDVIEFARGE